MNYKPNPGLAAVLSFIVNGLGQLYNGQIVKGLVMISLSAVGILVFVIAALLILLWLKGILLFSRQLIFGIFLLVSGFVFICVIGIYSILDAYQTALKK